MTRFAYKSRVPAASCKPWLNSLVQWPKIGVWLRGYHLMISSRQALEVLLGVTMKTLGNYANHVMHTPLDDHLKLDN